MNIKDFNTNNIYYLSYRNLRNHYEFIKFINSFYAFNDEVILKNISTNKLINIRCIDVEKIIVIEIITKEEHKLKHPEYYL